MKTKNIILVFLFISTIQFSYSQSDDDLDYLESKGYKMDSYYLKVIM